MDIKQAKAEVMAEMRKREPEVEFSDLGWTPRLNHNGEQRGERLMAYTGQHIWLLQVFPSVHVGKFICTISMEIWRKES